MRLINRSRFPEELIRRVIRFVKPSGVTVSEYILTDAKHPYNGRFWGRGRVLVRIGPDKAFPYKSHGCAGKGYIPGTWILSAEEAMVYVMAHECRHAWQKIHPRGYRVWGAKGKYSERDADAYAIRMLRAWRRGECPVEVERVAASPAPVEVKPAPSKTAVTLVRRTEQAKRLERKIKSLTTRLKRTKRSIAALERSMKRKALDDLAGRRIP